MPKVEILNQITLSLIKILITRAETSFKYEFSNTSCISFFRVESLLVRSGFVKLILREG